MLFFREYYHEFIDLKIYYTPESVTYQIYYLRWVFIGMYLIYPRSEDTLISHTV